jgi:hypothetical protein
MCYLTFDVECLGLHGEAFAWGAVLTTNDGLRLEEWCCVCDYRMASYHRQDFQRETNFDWLKENVLPVLPQARYYRPVELRSQFVEVFGIASLAAKSFGEPLHLATDVAFPCETNFLHALADEPMPDWLNPVSVYPLLDVSSMLLVRGYDPVGTYPRMPDELPKHNPLNDARQSSRILHALLRNDGTSLFEGVQTEPNNIVRDHRGNIVEDLGDFTAPE